MQSGITSDNSSALHDRDSRCFSKVDLRASVDTRVSVFSFLCFLLSETLKHLQFQSTIHYA